MFDWNGCLDEELKEDAVEFGFEYRAAPEEDSMGHRIFYLWGEGVDRFIEHYELGETVVPEPCWATYILVRENVVVDRLLVDVNKVPNPAKMAKANWAGREGLIYIEIGGQQKETIQ